MKVRLYLALISGAIVEEYLPATFFNWLRLWFRLEKKPGIEKIIKFYLKPEK